MEPLLKDALERSARFITDLNVKYCIEKLIEEVDELQHQVEQLKGQ